jgi:steroid delta-isomerase-like uncharacterized protein
MATSESIKAAVRQFIEVIDRQDWPAVKELASPTCRVRVGGHDLDRDAWLGMGQMFAAAFPDGKHEVQELVAEGDRVVSRSVWRGTHRGSFQGIPASGRAVAIDVMMMERIVDGRIVEHHVVLDALGLMQQIGALPG